MKHLLMQAADEIRSLRRQNELLAARVEVMDLFAMVLHTEPARRQSQGEGVDIAWKLDQRVAELEAVEPVPKPPMAAE